MLVKLAAPFQGAFLLSDLIQGAARKAACPWLPSAAPPVLVESILIGPAALPYLKKVYNVCAIQEMQIYEIKDLSADVR
ncbi:hypothetical protein BH18ACI4_BH18ACI4_26030 [soil metagenome]